MAAENLTTKQFLEALLAERAEKWQAVIATEEYRSFSELDQHIAFLRKRLGAEAVTLSESQAALPATNGHTPEVKPQHEIKLSEMSRIKAIVTILNTANRPMSTREIGERLRLGGIDMSPRNAMTSIYTSMVRSKELNKVNDVWGLKEWKGFSEAGNNNSPKKPAKKKANMKGGQMALPHEKPTVGLTIGEGAAKILKEAGEGLHVSEIATKLAGMGLTPSRPTLVSCLLKDRKHRFTLLGKNVFTLKDGHSRENGTPEQVAA